MRSDHLVSTLLQAILFLVSGGFLAAASAAFVSDGALDLHGLAAGRNLLQAKKSCPVDFESLNYTIVTSQCKGPQYPPKLCCAALKDFACPYADELNDGTNDCATTMFSYINLYGKYPPGLFASECREGKEGLSCPDSNVSAAAASASAANSSFGSSLESALVAAGIVLMFVFF